MADHSWNSSPEHWKLVKMEIWAGEFYDRVWKCESKHKSETECENIVINKHRWLSLCCQACSRASNKAQIKFYYRKVVITSTMRHNSTALNNIWAVGVGSLLLKHHTMLPNVLTGLFFLCLQIYYGYDYVMFYCESRNIVWIQLFFARQLCIILLLCFSS